MRRVFYSEDWLHRAQDFHIHTTLTWTFGFKMKEWPNNQRIILIFQKKIKIKCGATQGSFPRTSYVWTVLLFDRNFSLFSHRFLVICMFWLLHCIVTDICVNIFWCMMILSCLYFPPPIPMNYSCRPWMDRCENTWDSTSDMVNFGL